MKCFRGAATVPRAFLMSSATSPQSRRQLAVDLALEPGLPTPEPAAAVMTSESLRGAAWVLGDRVGRPSLRLEGAFPITAPRPELEEQGPGVRGGVFGSHTITACPAPSPPAQSPQKAPCPLHC